MWIIFITITLWSVVAFLTNHKRQSLLILTFLATSGFQLIPARYFWSPVLLVKPYDYAFVGSIAILLLNRNNIRTIINSTRTTIVAALYLLFILIVIIFSTALYSYNITQTIQSSRIFMWPIFLFLFLLVERDTLRRFSSIMLLIVLIQSGLYILQPITGSNIITPDGEYFNPYLGDTDLKRYLSTPVFIIFYILYVYGELWTKSPSGIWYRLSRFLAFVLLSSVQVISFTRSAIGGTIASLAYVSKRSIGPALMTFTVLFIATGILAGYFASQTVEHRIDETIGDIGAIADGHYLAGRAQKYGNLSYRLAHLYERGAFILETPSRWPIGIGFIHEESAKAQNLRFQIGLFNPLTGRPTQVDTGDIAWSVIVIKTGLVGTTLLIVLLVVSYTEVGRSSSPYSAAYRGGLIYFLITSFFSANLVTPNYAIPLMLFLALALQSRDDSQTNTTTRMDIKSPLF